MPKVFKPRTTKPSRSTRIIGWLKEHSWFINFLLTLSVFSVTQYQLHIQSQAIVITECRLSDSKYADLNFEDIRAVFGLATHCAIRNLGSKAVDLVEARTGLTFNGDLIQPPRSASETTELAKSIVINGEPFTRPVTLQPGGQATVELVLTFSAYAPAGSKTRNILMGCTQQKQVQNINELNSCVANLGVSWTDFLRGGAREFLGEFNPWTLADGLGGVFMLSSGMFAFGEVQFKYGWGWSCKPNPSLKLGPLPKYINCSDAPKQ